MPFPRDRWVRTRRRIRVVSPFLWRERNDDSSSWLDYERESRLRNIPRICTTQSRPLAGRTNQPDRVGKREEKRVIEFWFLVANTQIYKRLCPSVGPLFRLSVCHTRVVTLELKTRKTLGCLGCCSWYCLCVSVLEVGWGCVWGEARGWMPMPTRPQR